MPERVLTLFVAQRLLNRRQDRPPVTALRGRMPHNRLMCAFLTATITWTAAAAAQQPTGTIHGRVTDNAKQGISGVTLSVAGRTSLTQADGRYMIHGIPSGS